MSEFTGQVVSLGRITIPEAIRKANDISEGDYVVVTVKKVGKA